VREAPPPLKHVSPLERSFPGQRSPLLQMASSERSPVEDSDGIQIRVSFEVSPSS